MDAIPGDECTFISSGTNPLFTDGTPVFTDQSGTGRDSTCDIGAFEVPAVGIQVLDALTDIPDDTGTVDFRTTLVNKPVYKNFTVRNIGKTNPLTLSNLTVPSGFNIYNDFGTAIVSPGGHTTFGIELIASYTGTFSGQISFDNNVVDRSPFNFTVNGDVVEPVEIYLPFVLNMYSAP